MRCTALLPPLPIAAAHAATVPARFEADRVFATPTTTKGETLRPYTDTGGGMNLLCRDAARRQCLARFRMAPDHAHATAHFECLRDCGATPPPAP